MPGGGAIPGGGGAALHPGGGGGGMELIVMSVLKATSGNLMNLMIRTGFEVFLPSVGAGCSLDRESSLPLE
jgi:hypothetical protein